MRNENHKKVLVAGGSGLIGKALCKHLTSMGFEVSILSRSSRKGNYPTFLWNPEKNFVDLQAFENQDFIINLAGCGIADKLWTKKRKKLILSSRVKSIELISQGIQKSKNKPFKIIQASAIGYYGSQPAVILTEDSPCGSGFLTTVCLNWEKTTALYKRLSIPFTVVRIGIVLSKNGGYLDKIRKSLRFRTNLIFGNGEQKVSWIHIEDLVNIISFAMQPGSELLYNAVTPHPIKSRKLQKSIFRSVMLKSVDIKLPARMIQTLLGEFSSIFLSDQHVIPEKLINEKFQFQFSNLDDALNDLIQP